VRTQSVRTPQNPPDDPISAATDSRRSPPVSVLSARDLQRADRVQRLAYTRKQAAEALGVSLATLDRRVVPVIETVRTEWGARLIPVDELERYLAERRQEADGRQRAGSMGSIPRVPIERRGEPPMRPAAALPIMEA
jgi:hypothetical protein